MRRFCIVLLTCLLGWAGVDMARAAEYKIMDGTAYLGSVSGFDDNGVVFKLDSGGFTKERVPWSKFTQDSLKLLAEDARLKAFVEPFIEIPPDARPKPKPVVPVIPNRVERPTGRTTFFSSFTSPLGLIVLGLLYAANLLAGYEVALYRNRPAAMVCGLSAVVPVLGPLIFLISPALDEGGGGQGPAEEGLGEAGPAVASQGSPAAATSRRIGKPALSEGGGLKVAAHHDKGASGKVEKKIYNRAEYTFNRRFIETQFAGFFRVVPTEAEKDMVMVVKTAKQEYLSRRISRISANEMFMQLQQGGANEVKVTFGEIAQIIIRHKDDKSN